MPPDNSPLGTLHALFHLVLTTAMQRLHHCPCDTDEEDEDKKSPKMSQPLTDRVKIQTPTLSDSKALV